MHLYTVQPGDSPASIAAAHAGCPKCARDLVQLHAHRPSVVYPNGFATFRDPLRAGEQIQLPDKWFSAEFDQLPPAYFKALPHPDGTTLGVGATGILGDYATLESASSSVNALAPMSDQEFADGVDGAANLIDQSTTEVSADPKAAGYAKNALASTTWARQAALGMAAAVSAGDVAAASSARPEIRNVLNSALGNARLALQMYYGGVSPPAMPGSGPNVVAAAQVVAAAIAADPSYCVSVAHPGSSVNTAVHLFKLAWNTSGQTPQLPVGTSSYEAATAEALAVALGSSPAACGAHVPPSTPPSTPEPIALKTPSKTGISTGTILGMALLGAAATGGAIYLATRETAPTRRSSPRRSQRPPARRHKPFRYEI